MAVSALLLAHSVPNSLLGPIAGTFADRIDQRTLMIATDLGRAGVFILIAATLPSFAILVVLMTIAAVLETGFRPAGRSAVPALVEQSDLMSANAWLVTALNAGFATGPIIGGFLVATVGVPGALYANAGTFLVSALLLTRVPRLRAEDTEDEERMPFFATVREGLAFARKDRIVRAVVIGLFLGVAAAALDNVALVFMATRVLDAGPTGFGALETAFGIGMIAASLWLVRKTRFAAAGLFAVGWLGTAIGTLGVGFAPALGIALAAHMIGGIGNGIVLVGGDTLIQQNVPKQMLGRALGIAGSAPFLGSLIAYTAGGVLVDTVGARATFIIAGVTTAIVAVVVAVMLKGVKPPEA